VAKGGEEEMKELTISLEDDMFDTITKMAEKKGRTMSGEVTQLLKVALSNDFFTRVFRI